MCGFVDGGCHSLAPYTHVTRLARLSGASVVHSQELDSEQRVVQRVVHKSSLLTLHHSSSVMLARDVSRSSLFYGLLIILGVFKERVGLSLAFVLSTMLVLKLDL